MSEENVCEMTRDENEKIEYEKEMEKVFKYLEYSFYLYFKSLGDLLCKKKLQKHQNESVKKMLWVVTRVKQAIDMIRNDYGDEKFWDSLWRSFGEQIMPSNNPEGLSKKEMNDWINSIDWSSSNEKN